MVEQEVKVNLKAGIQSRAAAQFVQEASRYTSSIFVEKDGKKVNAKSIMGLMSLAVGTNSVVKLSANGEDEEQALAALLSIVENEE